MLSDYRRGFIGLGSNLGDSPSILSACVEHIASLDLLTILGCSSFYHNEPIVWPGDSPKPSYHNMVIAFAISKQLPVTSLFEQLQSIERQLGRTNSDLRWQSRLIDIDLLWVEDAMVNIPGGLVLPHPRFYERDFVIFPLLELDSDWAARCDWLMRDALIGMKQAREAFSCASM